MLDDGLYFRVSAPDDTPVAERIGNFSGQNRGHKTTVAVEGEELLQRVICDQRHIAGKNQEIAMKSFEMRARHRDGVAGSKLFLLFDKTELPVSIRELYRLDGRRLLKHRGSTNGRQPGHGGSEEPRLPCAAL